jgi:hypothetical protein
VDGLKIYKSLEDQKLRFVEYTSSMDSVRANIFRRLAGSRNRSCINPNKDEGMKQKQSDHHCVGGSYLVSQALRFTVVTAEDAAKAVKPTPLHM